MADEDNLEEIDFSKLAKKSKKSKSKKGSTESKEETPETAVQTEAVAEFPNYEYEQLIDRIFSLLHERNPTFNDERTRFAIPSPKIMKVGTKRIAWTNFALTCNVIDAVPDSESSIESQEVRVRRKDHLYQFTLAELQTQGSIDGSGSFIIRGKFTSKNIETVLSKYLKDHVICKNCHDHKTYLYRNNTLRVDFIRCLSCMSTYSVPNISFTYHAQTKADRKAARNA